MSKKDKINIQKSKIYKHYSCSQIYLYVANFNLNTNYLIKYFNISRTTYYRFKSKFNLLSPVDIFKNNLPIPTLPLYFSKKYLQAKRYFNEFIRKYKDFCISYSGISNWIKVSKQENVSIKMIRKIANENPNVFKTALRKRKKHNLSKKHNKFVNDDLVKMNYKTPNVIGVDGTNMKIFLEDKNSYKKLNCLISYIWECQKVLAYKFDKNENSNSVIKVFENISTFANNNNKKLIIQSDLGSAFANENIFNFVKGNKKITHSMSEKGFKHNSPTESLNGWIKQKFIKSFGDKFKNLNHFLNTFEKFIKHWNFMKEINYNIISKKKKN